MKTLNFLWLVVVIAASFATKAQALDFNFTFTGTDSDQSIVTNGAGTVVTTFDNQNTITGEILGLEDNASSSPTDVIIKSGVILGPNPLDLGDNAPYLEDGFPSFKVSNGQITATPELIGTYLDDHDVSRVYNFTLSGSGEFQTFTLGNGTIEYLNTIGGGVTFSPADAAAVPEPGQVSLVLAGLAGLVAWRRFGTRAISAE